jgi:hypothetical protein
VRGVLAEFLFLDGPCCARCGLPFEFDTGEETICAACHARPRAFDRARSLFAYDDASKPLILAFKYSHRSITHLPSDAGWSGAVRRSFPKRTSSFRSRSIAGGSSTGATIRLQCWRSASRAHREAARSAAVGTEAPDTEPGQDVVR